LKQPRLLDLFVGGDLRLLALPLPLGAVLGERKALRGAPNFDVVLLRQPCVFAFSLNVERLPLRIQILGPDFNLGTLFDLVAHAPARFNRFGQNVRPMENLNNEGLSLNGMIAGYVNR